MSDPQNRPRLPRPSGSGRTPPRKPKMSSLYRNIAMWALILLGVGMVLQALSPREQPPTDIPYSEFAEQLNAENVASVTIVEKEIVGRLRQSATTVEEGGEAETYTEFRTMLPFEDPDLVRRMEGRGVAVEARAPGIEWGKLFLTSLPWLLIIGIWIFLLRQMQGGGSRAFSFGKSKARLLSADAPKVTFDDVAGADEAKEELEEIIDFLRDPKKFQRLGGRIPKGVLLLGPPGTGKTLLARAVAGEAGVPFFSMSGSDFVEMFVGVGASRVRDLFEQGKAHAPCIIFIDEIDAVGRHRGAGLGGGHDEREQTLNQLLVEMDGFESNEGVILIAATNRPDVLDPALLRPGRFDRQVVVDRPDVRGREGIFRVHTRDIPLADDVDHKTLAKGTPGLSGADIENIVNEAALTAARNNRSHVTMHDFEEAKDKVMMGAERRSLVISDDERRSIAYHEAGHALVRMKTPAADPVHKVTIIPRGRALGVTHFLPEDERHIYTREWCENQLTALLGGRAAEVLVLKATTTGAGDDLQRATDLARRMVTKWGMSEALGPLTYGDEQEQVFLGREIAQHRDYSDETAMLIDKEVKRIVTDAFERAVGILEASEPALHRIAEALLEREILDAEEIQLLLEGEDLAVVEPEQGTDRAEGARRPPVVESADREPATEEVQSGEPAPAAAESARAARMKREARADEKPLPSDT